MQVFPESALVISQQISFTQVGSDVKVEKIKDEDNIATKQWNFKSPNGFQLIVALNNFTIVSDFHKTYSNPDSENRFRDVIEFVCDAFFSFIPSSIKLSRIGLRYTDECPLVEKTSANVNESFNLISYSDRFTFEETKELSFRVVLQKGDLNIIYQESLGYDNEKKENFIGLDFDGFAENIVSTTCLATTDRLHDLIRSEYVASLKKPVYEYMRGSQK